MGNEPPGPQTTLEHYPWIVVRFRCRSCKSRRDKRLALLAEEFGAATEVQYLLGLFVAACPHRPRKRNGRVMHRYVDCGAYCPDLGSTLPPDLPPSLAGLRLIEGGRKDMLPAEDTPAERRRRVGGDDV